MKNLKFVGRHFYQDLQLTGIMQTRPFFFKFHLKVFFQLILRHILPTNFKIYHNEDAIIRCINCEQVIHKPGFHIAVRCCKAAAGIAGTIAAGMPGRNHFSRYRRQPQP